MEFKERFITRALLREDCVNNLIESSSESGLTFFFTSFCTVVLDIGFDTEESGSFEESFSTAFKAACFASSITLSTRYVEVIVSSFSITFLLGSEHVFNNRSYC